MAAIGIKKAVEEENGKFISIEDLQIKAKIGQVMTDLLDEFGCFQGMSKSNQMSLFDGNE